MSERVLSLDISTKTGWACIISKPDGIELEDTGQVKQIPEPQGYYPSNYVEWAYMVFGEIMKLIDTYHPDVLVIEETAGGSKNVMSQKILEYTHFLVAKFIRETGIRSFYFMTEQWRRETGCQMTKEELKANRKVAEYKKRNDTSIAYDPSGKRVGKITRKHVNIRRANELFGQYLEVPLRKKDEDTADALMLAYAYHARKMRNL
jgi:Holliday junction resolvasome RuvABC endonuclease subunit